MPASLIGGDTTATPGPLTLVDHPAFGEVPAGRMVPRAPVRGAGGIGFMSPATIGDAALGLRLRLAAHGDAAWIAALERADADTLRDRYLLP